MDSVNEKSVCLIGICEIKVYPGDRIITQALFIFCGLITVF